VSEVDPHRAPFTGAPPPAYHSIRDLMNALADRLLLVLCALVVASTLLGWMMVADRGLGLSREQNLFVGGARDPAARAGRGEHPDRLW
jgi:hypothetical protein